MRSTLATHKFEAQISQYEYSLYCAEISMGITTINIPTTYVHTHIPCECTNMPC